jgi:YVTN family beta-propeller protein
VTVGGLNKIAAINTATMKVIASADVGINPMGVAVAPNGSYALSVDTGSHQVSRLIELP